MPRYQYVAYKEGIRHTGQMTATAASEVADRLDRDGFLVSQVVDETVRSLPFINQARLRLDDKIFLIQSLSTFLAAGVPIVEALRMTGGDAQSPRLVAVLDGIALDLQAGKRLAESLGRYPESFDSVFLALVEAGEESGKLQEIFTSLAMKYKQDAQTLSRVRSALIYPLIVLIALVGLGLVLTFFVLPRITDVFTRFSIDLPLLTRLLIVISRWVSQSPWLVAGGLVFVTFSGVSFFFSKQGRRSLEWLGTHLPFVKTTFWYLDLQRFTATLAILIEAAVPIQDALVIAGKTIRHPLLARQIPQAAAGLAAGRSLATSLEATALPRTVISLMAAGEQSGALGRNLHELDEFYRDHLDESLRNVTGFVEPLLTFIVGIIVAAVVLAVIVPLYQLIGQLNGGS
ncbi:type II secretion system F family protein [Candidatus Berkelbacteria bacterium]|nr:type II secretion system F family protein [Candidatus Berkelbacteria bacterium]